MPDQVVQVNFAAGLDQRTDAHHTQPGRLLSAVNCVFDKVGAVRKRFGTVSRGNTTAPNNNVSTVVGPSSLTSAYSEFAYRSEDVVLAGNRLYSRSGNQSAWLSMDNAPEAVATRSPLAANNASTTYYSPDCAVANGLICYVWQSTASTSGAIYAAIYEVATGALVYAPSSALVSSGATNPRVVAMGNTFVVTWITAPTNTTIVVRTLDTTATPYAWTTGVSLITNAANPGGSYDLCAADATHLYLAYETATTGGISVYYFDDALLLKGTRVVGTDTSVKCIALQGTVGETLYVGWSANNGGATTFVKVGGLDPVFLIDNFAASTLYSGSNAVESISLARVSASLECVGYTFSTSGVYQFRRVVLTNLGAVNSTADTYNVRQWSKLFQQGGKTYGVFYDSSKTHGSYFLCDVNSDVGTQTDQSLRVVACVAPRLIQYATTLHASNSLSSVVLMSSGTWAAPINVLVSTGSTTILKLWRASFDFAHSKGFLGGSIGGSYAFGASSYDGQLVTELGFYVYPDGYTGAPDVTSGGLTQNATYGYLVTYEWTGASGETVRSAVGSGVSVATGTSTSAVLSNIPLLSLTAKTDDENGLTTQPSVVVYRTLANGSTYYEVGRFANVKTLATASFSDTTNDATIQSNPVLYTTGGRLASVCPPSFTHTVIHKNRIFGIGDDGKTIWYSQYYEDGLQPAFSEALTMLIEDAGQLTGLATMDDKLVAFSDSAAWVIYGDGPNATGAGVDYSVQRLATDNGCTEQRSIVLTPDGVMRQTKAGLFLLTRALQDVYVGADVEDILASYPTITSACALNDRREVRFTCQGSSSGITLVANYFNPPAPYAYRWSSLQHYDSVAATASTKIATSALVGGQWRFVTAQDHPFYEDNTGGTYMDGGSASANWVTMSVESAWFEVSGVGGTHRIKRVGIVGDWYTSHNLTIGIATQYNASYSSPTGQTTTFLSNTIDSAIPEEVRVHVVNQKGHSLRVKVSDGYPTSAGAVVGTGRGFSLAGLAVTVMPKRGIGQSLPSRQMG